MGKWARVKDATASGDKLPNLVAGEFKVKISKIKDVEGRSGDLFYIIEMEILESSTPEIVVGRFYSYVIKFNIDMGPINVKRFLLPANGFDAQDPDNDNLDFLRAEGVLDEGEDWEDLTDASLSEDQPYSGLVMHLTCIADKTQKKTDFTKHMWHPATEEDNPE